MNGRRGFYLEPAASPAEALGYARSFARMARTAVGQRRVQLLGAARLCLAEALDLRGPA